MGTLEASVKFLNRKTEEKTAEGLAQSLGFEYANLEDYPFSIDALELLPLEEVIKHGYAPYLRTKDRIRFAVVHPEERSVLDELAILENRYGVTFERTVVSQTSFRFLIDAYTKLLEERKQKEVAAKDAGDNNVFKRITTLENLEKELSIASVTDVLEIIIAAAYNQGASDIHLEPQQDLVSVRFRIDGVLRLVTHIQQKQHKQIVSRVKMMTNMKLDEQSNIQDGRFSMQPRGINADFRVSVVPTGFGPAVVMRILRQDMQALSLKELGFSDHNLVLVEKAIHRPYGLIVVTGPTGSGKSTTLYAILKELNSPEKKILTLEDPIEYRLPGIQQSQVDPDRGFTFAEGLKGALRQDPDIVMVGEIRDPETATIALNAALTGHLVLSTLHTNDAITAHTRFLELGVPPFLLNGTIQLIVAQRLVRKVVPGGTAEEPNYSGRLVIAEVLKPDVDFEQAVLAHVDMASLHDVAVKGGMVPMLDDGIAKVKAGITTEQEIYRVTAFS